MAGCSKCGGARDRNGRYCRSCHAEYMRGWRPRHSDLPEEERRRATTRAYLRAYIRRGKVTRGPCEICGVAKVHAHHEDYSKPLDVHWLCADHHRDLHRLRPAADSYDAAVSMIHVERQEVARAWA